ncbi:MAG: hypothetical protein HPY73_06015 [Methanomassiliicoccales archaeon]|nr:MAG: hypothetical protein HPY73_06015 [Methanomassiliicoccales archaeon]
MSAEPTTKDIDSQDDDPEENERAIALGLFGKFNLNDGVASGKFVTFMIDEENVNISDFKLRSNVEMIQLFDFLAIEGYELNKNDVKVTGSILKIGKAALSIKMHDNPTGMVQIKNQGEERRIKILLAEGINASKIDNEGNQTIILITGIGIRGSIINQNGSVDIEDTDQGVYINMTAAPNDNLMIRFHPMIGERNGEMENAVFQGLMGGVLGAELSISSDEDGVDYEDLNYDASIRVKVEEAEHEKVVIEVSSDVHSGRVILVNMDKKIVSGTGDISVKVDGSDVEVVAIDGVVPSAIASEDDAVSALADADGVVQILIYIPSFSSHDISIVPSYVKEDEHGMLEWGMALIGAIAVLSLAGYVLIRRH